MERGSCCPPPRITFYVWSISDDDEYPLVQPVAAQNKSTMTYGHGISLHIALYSRLLVLVPLTGSHGDLADLYGLESDPVAALCGT